MYGGKPWSEDAPSLPHPYGPHAEKFANKLLEVMKENRGLKKIISGSSDATRFQSLRNENVRLLEEVNRLKLQLSNAEHKNACLLTEHQLYVEAFEESEEKFDKIHKISSTDVVSQ